MSKQEHVLKIEPRPDHAVEEKYEYYGFMCTSCNGRGGYTSQVGHDEYKTETCQMCDGTGKLSASVDVKWKPFYN